jgi:4-amino-4-deoxy-L-arabinose transferase
MSRRRAALLVLAALSWSLLFLGTRPLTDPDEGRYGEASREMLVAQHPWYPTLGGRPHLTKPPLTYWLSASGMALFGQNEWGARAGLALAFTTWIVAAWAVGRRWSGSERAGLGAALALATSPLPYAAASTLSTDAVLAAADGVAIACAARALTDPAERRAAVRWMWLALGAAFLAKGPPGLLPLAGVALAWPLRAGPRRGERWIDLVSAAAFGVVGLGWYVAMVVDDPARLRMFLGEEVVDRFFTNRFAREGPAWLPLLTLAGGGLLWTPCGIAALRRAPAVDGGPALQRLLGGWILTGLVVFTLSRSRMPFYTVPLVLGIAAPAGARAVKRFAAWTPRRRVAGLAALVLLAALLAELRREPERFSSSVRHSADVARAARAELDALGAGPAAPVVALQGRYPPGLAFYLRRPILTTGLRPGDGRFGPDLAGADLAAWLATQGGLAVAVGEPPAFRKLPAGIRVSRQRHAAASRYLVATISDR